MIISVINFIFEMKRLRLEIKQTKQANPKLYVATKGHDLQEGFSDFP